MTHIVMKGADFMNFRKIIAMLLCTFLLTGCGNTDIEPGTESSGEKTDNSGISRIETTDIENGTKAPVKKAEDPRMFRIGSMENEADLNECSLHGWCRITDEDWTYRTTYKGDFEDNGDLWEFITNLDTSVFEEERNGLADEYSVAIKGDTAGFVRIASGMTTVYGYDDLDNATESYEPAISIQTGESAAESIETVYLVPYTLKRQFDEIIANAVENENNITDVYKLPDYSYTEITDSHPKDHIVFVDGYSNYAWEPQDHGRFIDIHGYVYEYNMDGRSIVDEARERTGNDTMTYDQAFVDALYYEFYYKNSPVAMVDADTIFDCYTKMFTIDRDADFEEKHEAYDYGQHSLYMIDIDDQENMCLKLRTKGDNTGHLDDPSAEEIMKIYDSLKIKKIN